VRRALAREPADRIPIDFWASAGMLRKLERRLGCDRAGLLDRYDVDLRYIDGPRYVGPPLPPDTDIWGVRRTVVRVGPADTAEEYSEAAEAPLAAAETAADVAAYPRWPSPDWFDYGVVEAQCDAVRATGRAVVFMGDRLNRVAQLKPAMYLRGVEAILTDLALDPGLAAAIMGRIHDFYLEYLRRILDAARGKIDLVLTGDDFGSQHGLLVSRDMWCRALRPGFAACVALIKRSGARAMHHTCGAVAELIPDFIDCGLDVLQSLQPEAPGMDLGALQRQFGDRLAFHGGISIQRTLPFGTPDEVRREVRAIADAARARGGYIFCTAHNIQADTPVENVEALLAAYRDYGSG
jgi:uroporphyrinogen decarboxylase